MLYNYNDYILIFMTERSRFHLFFLRVFILCVLVNLTVALLQLSNLMYRLLGLCSRNQK